MSSEADVVRMANWIDLPGERLIMFELRFDGQRPHINVDVPSNLSKDREGLLIAILGQLPHLVSEFLSGKAVEGRASEMFTRDGTREVTFDIPMMAPQQAEELLEKLAKHDHDFARKTGRSPIFGGPSK
jgi:hypothetical protein